MALKKTKAEKDAERLDIAIKALRKIQARAEDDCDSDLSDFIDEALEDMEAVK